MAQTKQQKELMVLATLVVVATVVWFLYFGKRNTDGAATLAARGPYVPIDAVNYGKVFIGLSEAQNTEYKASGRNIFVAGPPPAPPPEAAAAPKVETHYINSEPQLPPPPPPPQLNMKFFGVGTLPASGPKRAFLLDGEEVHIVSEGDSLPGNLRIIHIGNDRIEFEDTVTGLKNSKAIEMPPPA